MSRLHQTLYLRIDGRQKEYRTFTKQQRWLLRKSAAVLMICTVDLPAFELNWTYYLFTLYLDFFSINMRRCTNDSSPSSLAFEGLTTATNTNTSRSDSENIRNSREISHSRSDSEISDSGLLLTRMRRHVTFTPDTVFENRRTSKEYRTFTKQQRRLLRNQRRQTYLEIFCLKWTIGNIHIWVLSLVDESS